MTSFMMFYMCNSNFISNLTLYIRSLSLSMYITNKKKRKKSIWLKKILGGKRLAIRKILFV